MILYASTKMDISNYVSWLIKRLNAGFFDRELNPKIINRYLLEDIEELILCTRTPSKIYKNRESFSQYNTKLITFVTLYDQFYEPKIKDKEKILECIRKCKKYFNNYLGYGPIFYTSNHNKEWHLSQFDFLCKSVGRFIKGIYISFDVNEFCQKNKKLNVYHLSEIEQKQLIKELSEIAKKYNLEIYQLKNEKDFDENDLDIGTINCCPYACEYCPNINNKKAAIDKYKVFDDNNSMLYGIKAQNQKIVEIKIGYKPKENENEEFSQSSLFDFLNL